MRSIAISLRKSMAREEDIDLQLVRLFKNGDKSAFEDIVNRHQDRVFNIIYRMIDNYEEAEDLTQEVFIKVFKSLKKFKQRSTFSTWLYRVTVNMCIDAWRKKNKRGNSNKDWEFREDWYKDTQRVMSNEASSPDLIDPEEIRESNELKERVQKAISKLSYKYRIVIILHDLQGFSYREISDIFNCPMGTTKSCLHKARMRLKSLLSESDI